ncbi:expressed unknown protein [Seminavis robusta]|uniref:Uncharacterized protein n=1 Tax=Seminavis robusta TaxID=568900 RepID=A0A9N8EDY7_9STRA|nr:expressed unknown protein [Seminavis robusta]|eukprot:Sro855_g211470.1 n/a (323) ;mRNA; f:38449-39597
MMRLFFFIVCLVGAVAVKEASHSHLRSITKSAADQLIISGELNGAEKDDEEKQRFLESADKRKKKNVGSSNDQSSGSDRDRNGSDRSDERDNRRGGDNEERPERENDEEVEEGPDRDESNRNRNSNDNDSRNDNEEQAERGGEEAAEERPKRKERGDGGKRDGKSDDSDARRKSEDEKDVREDNPNEAANREDLKALKKMTQDAVNRKIQQEAEKCRRRRGRLLESTESGDEGFNPLGEGQVQEGGETMMGYGSDEGKKDEGPGETMMGYGSEEGKREEGPGETMLGYDEATRKRTEEKLKKFVDREVKTKIDAEVGAMCGE